jgi:hypothetical protein
MNEHICLDISVSFRNGTVVSKTARLKDNGYTRVWKWYETVRQRSQDIIKRNISFLGARDIDLVMRMNGRNSVTHQVSLQCLFRLGARTVLPAPHVKTLGFQARQL